MDYFLTHLGWGVTTTANIGRTKREGCLVRLKVRLPKGRGGEDGSERRRMECFYGKPKIFKGERRKDRMVLHIIVA